MGWPPEDRGTYQLSNTLCYPALVTAWLGLYVPTFFIIVHTGTTAASNTTTTTTAAPSSSFNFIDVFPQSAISLVSLASFIGISIGIAILAEKCYERLSLRDDSSDMSEHTKEILRARILGMVFGKKIQLSMMTDKQKKLELAKKYAHLWQYKAAMRKQRRKVQMVERKRKSSVWSGFFGKNEDESKTQDRPKSSKLTRTISKKPTQPSITENPPVKDKREAVEGDFVAIDIKPTTPVPAAIPAATTANSKVQKNNTVSGAGKTATVKAADTSKTQTSNNSKNKPADVSVKIDNDQYDEFDLVDISPVVRPMPKQPSASALMAAKKHDNKSIFANMSPINREGSMNKYVRPPSSMGAPNNPQASNSTAATSTAGIAATSKTVSRPLTAGGSRPITAGAKRSTTEYKNQGKSVRNDLLKKLGNAD